MQLPITSVCLLSQACLEESISFIKAGQHTALSKHANQNAEFHCCAESCHYHRHLQARLSGCSKAGFFLPPFFPTVNFKNEDQQSWKASQACSTLCDLSQNLWRDGLRPVKGRELVLPLWSDQMATNGNWRGVGWLVGWPGVHTVSFWHFEASSFLKPGLVVSGTWWKKEIT